MQKKLIILVILVVAVVGGYFVFGGNKEVKNEELGNVNNEEQSSGKKMAFSQFLKQGGAYKCEVKQSMSDFENSGTMYVNGKTLRGEFSTIAEGRKMNSSFISRDGYTYTWSSLAPNMGFKMKTSENETSGSDVNNSTNYAWSAEQIGDYNCENWSVDTSKFELPKDVNFTELQSN